MAPCALRLFMKIDSVRINTNLNCIYYGSLRNQTGACKAGACRPLLGWVQLTTCDDRYCHLLLDYLTFIKINKK